MLLTVLTLLLGYTLATPLDQRQSCPNIHVFGARETTAPPGYGSSDTVVNKILNAYAGSTSEAIDYPACGGQSSCGGVSYSESVQSGIGAVASAVNSFHSNCPDTELVLVGYSQVCPLADPPVQQITIRRARRLWMLLYAVAVIPAKASRTPPSSFHHRQSVWSRQRS